MPDESEDKRKRELDEAQAARRQALSRVAEGYSAELQRLAEYLRRHNLMVDRAIPLSDYDASLSKYRDHTANSPDIEYRDASEQDDKDE